MTAPSAIELIEEVRRLGGHLTPKPPDKLGVAVPESEQPRLLPLIRERKPDLLMLLRYPSTACPACNGDRFWRDGVGLWCCAKCEPENPPDPFGLLPAGEADALAELDLREKLRQPEYARLIVSGPGAPGLRSLMIRAAAVVWAAGGPEAIGRRHAAAWDGVPPALVEGRRFSFAPNPFASGEWVRNPRGEAAEVLAYDADSGRVLVRSLADPPRWAWFAPAALVSEMDWRPE